MLKKIFVMGLSLASTAVFAGEAPDGSLFASAKCSAEEIVLAAQPRQEIRLVLDEGASRSGSIAYQGKGKLGAVAIEIAIRPQSATARTASLNLTLHGDPIQGSITLFGAIGAESPKTTLSFMKASSAARGQIEAIYAVECELTNLGSASAF